MPLLILIAEDDPGIRLALNDYLEMSGYTVLTANNGNQAMSMLENYHPHLLISDIRMPGKNGYELIKQVRQRPEFRLLPVIFLTERRTTEDRIRGYQAGCDIYLPKPFEMEELGAVIRNLLERSQMIHSELRFSTEKFHGKSVHIGVNKDIQNASFHNLEFTKREQEVLNLLTKGFSNAEIGGHLHLSPRTIEKYVSSLLRKTETNNRAELIRFALDRNLVE